MYGIASSLYFSFCKIILLLSSASEVERLLSVGSKILQGPMVDPTI
jgi:hypothetical protein